MANILDFTPSNIDQYLLQNEKPVIIIFYRYDSSPCEMYKTRYTRAAALMQDTAIMGLVDIELDQEILRRFSIFSIPTTLIFWKGVLIRQYIGIQESDVLTDVIRGALTGQYEAFVAESRMAEQEVPEENEEDKEETGETTTEETQEVL